MYLEKKVEANLLLPVTCAKTSPVPRGAVPLGRLADHELGLEE